MAGVNLHLNGSLGCVFVGILFALLLYGITCAQTLYYAWHYRDNKITLKVLVAVLWMLDTARTCFDSQFLWYYFIKNRANPYGLETIANTFPVEYILADLAIVLVQCFFMYNIWKLLAGKWYRIPLSASALLLSLMSLAGGLGVVYKEQHDSKFQGTIGSSTAEATVNSVCAFVTDVYITVTLCLVLRGQSSEIKRTQQMLSKLTIYAINRGVLTSVVQMLVFIQYKNKGKSLLAELFHAPSSTLYVNTFLAILDVRQHLNKGDVAFTESVFDGVQATHNPPSSDLEG
ncbi:uncharacterized protein LAESUDRAFT_721352 [Laetiporus sulphureus 93-53]|uniref:DUF6534 domain-containing protein n=1 Tax=Laetiporus sulphureus 93-53 TaxID=1314785 RepID=A0A165GWY6_9APHY|nr:uncharacterized protein LAESUDRAFT_721352 [Laetiporus sulphureus 93-53]KZT10940.1 hypothetical protein LAESUDRAFT_721352 [Laetiporus sulphureus 93-53]